jgi:hypothetical protein
MVRLIKAARGNINTRHGEDAGRSFPHVGIDIGWGGGKELYAPAAGWISWAWVGTYGNRCIIRHDDDTWSLIAHAETFFGNNGRRVEQGEHIGTMGRTGGPWGSIAGWFVHCHQEYHLANGTAVDPLDYMSSSTAGDDYDPIPEDDMYDEAARNELIGERIDQNILPKLQTIINQNAALAARLEYSIDVDRRENRRRAIFDAGVSRTIPESAAQRAALVDAETVYPLPADPKERAVVWADLKEGGDILIASAEHWQPQTTLEFFRTIDAAGGHPAYGAFVENVFELEAGSTQQVRSNGTVIDYPDRVKVWADGRPVRVTKGGKTVERFLRDDHGGYAQVDGQLVALTPTEITRADAQRVAGQNWEPVRTQAS